MRFDAKEAQEEFNKVFGNVFIADDDRGILTVTNKSLSIDNISAQQIWFLVKFAKHIRLRCKNNTALNNYLNQLFPNATFRQVPKTNSRGIEYMGLSIEVNGEVIEETDDMNE